MKKINLIAVVFLGLISTSCYDFNRTQDRLDAENEGKGILLKAESEKKAMVEEAKAKSESAILASQGRLKSAENDAAAKLKRSAAEAKSIEVVGKAIQQNPEYVRYLQVQSINGSKSQKVFIPTENNMPILIAK
jgi:regulator of protease activity HflC (stomatin/prohibitin superfamily)